MLGVSFKTDCLIALEGFRGFLPPMTFHGESFPGGPQPTAMVAFQSCRPLSISRGMTQIVSICPKLVMLWYIQAIAKI